MKRKMVTLLIACLPVVFAAIAYAAEPARVSLAAIGSPIVFRGDATTA